MEILYFHDKKRYKGLLYHPSVQFVLALEQKYRLKEL